MPCCACAATSTSFCWTRSVGPVPVVEGVCCRTCAWCMMLHLGRHLNELLLDQLSRPAVMGGGCAAVHVLLCSSCGGALKTGAAELHPPATFGHPPMCPPSSGFHHAVQLPVLRDLQRVLDELAFGVSSQQPVATPSRLIVEQVGSAGGRAGAG